MVVAELNPNMPRAFYKISVVQEQTLKKKNCFMVLEYKTHYFLWKWLNLIGYCKSGIP